MRAPVYVKEGKGGQTVRRSSLHAHLVIPLLPAGCAAACWESSVAMWLWAPRRLLELLSGCSTPWSWGIQTNTHHTGEM